MEGRLEQGEQSGNIGTGKGLKGDREEGCKDKMVEWGQTAGSFSWFSCFTKS